MGDAPIEEGSDEATREEQLRGILAQVQEDVRMGHAHDADALLRQRLDEAGLSATDDEIRSYLGE
ncbi:hypothetical protein FLP10_08240 [Agromyces intestinalis]|uniref:Uncharacterized protein n=1 Tax=Agromyces intestinalis TaxID=2592652 RepID=A0A5C1YI12_9MICO|nr:hypothetical protein [Agromyces intestinalis]QEO14412.1 hypothetical protein FLP10_08240 [Agromyces intestinalis]